MTNQIDETQRWMNELRWTERIAELEPHASEWTGWKNGRTVDRYYSSRPAVDRAIRSREIDGASPVADQIANLRAMIARQASA